MQSKLFANMVNGEHLLVPFVVRFFGDSQVKWIVSRFIAKPHEILSLA
jgi:hypothetical protein